MSFGDDCLALIKQPGGVAVRIAVLGAVEGAAWSRAVYVDLAFVGYDIVVAVRAASAGDVKRIT